MTVVEADISISISVDGFVTGPNLEEDPGLGEGGEVLHAWLGEPEGQEILREAFAAAGAVITSRKVFDGTGGWGDEPPYHMPVFVVTHRPHQELVKGDTTFTFVTGGVEDAIAQASAVAGDKNIHVMGGASVIQQALEADLVDQLFLHVTPVLLGGGTPLFGQLTRRIELERIEAVETPSATHLRYRIVR